MSLLQIGLIVWAVAVTVSCLTLSCSLILAARRFDRIERALWCDAHQEHHGSCWRAARAWRDPNVLRTYPDLRNRER